MTSDRAIDERTVGVIMPVYNRGDLVGDAIASALGQTHPAVEVHVVDDGSTDHTGAVLDEIAASEERVRVVHQPNAGPAAARNRAIAGCGTTWITFLDSDDLLVPDAVESQFAWLDDNPGHDGVMGRVRSEIQSGVDPPPLVAAKLAADDETTIFHTVLIRRATIQRVGGYDESLRVAEDTDLHWRLIEGGVKLGVREESLITRRVFGDNLSYENTDGRASLLDMVQRSIDRTRRDRPPSG